MPANRTGSRMADRNPKFAVAMTATSSRHHAAEKGPRTRPVLQGCDPSVSQMNERQLGPFERWTLRVHLAACDAACASRRRCDSCARRCANIGNSGPPAVDGAVPRTDSSWRSSARIPRRRICRPNVRPAGRRRRRSPRSAGWSPRRIRWRSKRASQILRQGGSAVDAAIAVQLVLGLVEPQSSGLGGGAFMLLHDAKANEARRLRRPRDRARRRDAGPVPRRTASR